MMKNSKLCLSESVPFSVRGRFRVGLGDRKYCLVSIKVIEVYGKSPQFTETRVCVCVCVCVSLFNEIVCLCFYHLSSCKIFLCTSFTLMPFL